MSCYMCEREAIDCFDCTQKAARVREQRIDSMELESRRWYAALSESTLEFLYSGAWNANDVGGAERVKLEKIRRGLITLEEANRSWPKLEAKYLWI